MSGNVSGSGGRRGLLKIAIRCDASAQIGFGHLTRMITLANELRRMAKISGLPLTIIFLIKEVNPQVLELLAHHQFGYEVVDDEAARRMEQMQLDLLIVDHYGIDREQLRQLKMAVRRLLLIDDYQPERVTGAMDVVVNVNPGGDQLPYPAIDGQVRWFGPQFALLRPQFAEALRRADQEVQLASHMVPADVRRILICFGGADPQNVTLKMLQVVAEWHRNLDIDRGAAGALQLTVILGPANGHRSSVEQFCEDWCRTDARLSISLLSNVDQMADMMLAQDLLILPASTIALEGVALGVPCAVLVTVENQILLGEALARMGASWKLADYRDGAGRYDDPAWIAVRLAELTADSRLRRALAERGRQLIDAAGATRLAAQIIDFLEERSDENETRNDLY